MVHANRYQLFVERALALTRAGGRLGLVLPSGLATDQGSASLRRKLFTTCDVDAFVSIDNRRGIFPIHRSVRFLLLTASPGRATDSVACRDLDDPAELEGSRRRSRGSRSCISCRGPSSSMCSRRSR